MFSTLMTTGTPSLTPATLLRIACELAERADTWRTLVEHDADARWFARISAGDDHDAWLIGWDSFQGVDLHDHGGSAGALYVLDGMLLELSTNRDVPLPLHEQALPAGAAWVFGPGHVHRVVNPSAAVATSIHVYSPPLVSMDFYEPDATSALSRTHTEPALGSRSGRGELR